MNAWSRSIIMISFRSDTKISHDHQNCHSRKLYIASELFYLVGWFIYLWQATALSAAAPPATPATPSCCAMRTPALRTPAAPTPTASHRATGPSAGADRDTRYGFTREMENIRRGPTFADFVTIPAIPSKYSLPNTKEKGTAGNLCISLVLTYSIFS